MLSTPNLVAGDPDLRAAELRAEAAIPPSPPIVDLNSIGRLRQVASVRIDAGLSTDGLTLHDDAGFHIVLRPQTPTRQRFTLAHEIGHTFFYARDTVGAWKHRSFGAEEEGWCHNFARALLMPPAWLQRDIAEVAEVSLAGLDGLTLRYEVSLEALLARLGQLQIWPTLVLTGVRTAQGWSVRRVTKSVDMPGVSTGLRWGSAHPGAHLLEQARAAASASAAGPIDWPVAFRPRGKMFRYQNDFWAEARVYRREGADESVMLVHHDVRTRPRTRSKRREPSPPSSQR